MRGINKAYVMGNLGHDVELRKMTNGTSVVNLRVATNRQWQDSKGQQKEETEWHNVVTFGRQADLAADYLGKGSQVFVEGRMRTRQYQDRGGQQRSVTEIIATDIHYLSKKETRAQHDDTPPPHGAPVENQNPNPGNSISEAPSTGNRDHGSQPPPPDQYNQPPQERQGRQGNVDDGEDEIPF